jgi:hypothetical protein
MALVQSRNRRANSASPSNMLIPALYGLLSGATNSASRQVVNNLMQSKSGSNGSNRGQNQGGNTIVVTGGGRRKKRRNRKGAGGGLGPVPTGNALSNFRITGSNSRQINTTMRGVFQISNNSAGVNQTAWWMGFNAGGTMQALMTLPASDVNLLKAFTYARISSFSIKYTGTTGTTSSGFMALGYTDSVAGIATPLFSDVSNSRVNVVVSQVSSGGITVPIQNNQPIYLNDTAQDQMHKAYGQILLFGSNGLASGAIIGVVELSFNLTLW